MSVIQLHFCGMHRYFALALIYVYPFSRNGVAIKLTVDHKPSLQEERDRMRAAGLEISDTQTRINGTLRACEGK